MYFIKKYWGHLNNTALKIYFFFMGCFSWGMEIFVYWSLILDIDALGYLICGRRTRDARMSMLKPRVWLSWGKRGIAIHVMLFSTSVRRGPLLSRRRQVFLRSGGSARGFFKEEGMDHDNNNDNSNNIYNDKVKLAAKSWSWLLFLLNAQGV